MEITINVWLRFSDRKWCLLEKSVSLEKLVEWKLFIRSWESEKKNHDKTNLVMMKYHEFGMGTRPEI